MDIRVGGCRGWKWQAGERPGRRFMVVEKEDMKLAGVREEDADDWGKMEAHDWLRPLQTRPA